MKTEKDKRTLAPVPPRALDEQGRPRFGAYLGLLADSSLTGLAPELDLQGLRRLAAEKAWHYAALLSPRWFTGLAVVRMGYGGLGFFFLFDRKQRVFLADTSALGPPGLAARVDDRPGDGAESTFRMPGLRLSILSPPGTGRYAVRARVDGAGQVPVDLALELDREAAPEAVTAVCPVADRGVVQITVKQVALPARGRLLVGGLPMELGDDPTAIVDYSHGLLARTTNWFWACAGGRDARGLPLGINLVAGFNQGLENALWVGERPWPVGLTRFTRGAGDPLAPWHIESDDGRVSLDFQPEGTRSEDKDLGLVASHYVQPVGTFSGTLRGERGRKVTVRELPGVVEEHASRW